MFELEELIRSEMKAVLEEEEQYNASSGSIGGAHNFHTLFASVLNNVSKIEKVGNIYEAIEKDSYKLQNQIQSCFVFHMHSIG